MERSSAKSDAPCPEKLVDLLVGRLKRQALRDILLQVFPPLLVFLYLALFLYRNGWIAPETLMFAGAVLLGVALFIGLLRHRSRAPAIPYAARLIDEKVGGKDRFITLVTIDPLNAPSFLVDRLRHEAAGFLSRLDLRRDFPYRMKRSFFAWLIGSLAVMLLFHFLLPIALPLPSRTPSTRELETLAQKMSQIERFSELARNLQATAAQLQKQNLSQAEKRSLVQEAFKKVESHLGAGQQQGKGNGDLLGQVAKSLRGLEQGLEKGQGQKGGGGTKTSLPEERESGGKELAQGNEGKEEDESRVSKNQDLKDGNSGNDKKTLATTKSQREGDQGRKDKAEKEKEKGREKEGLAKEEREGKGTRNPGEEIPRATPPDRFLQPGEQGEKGIKGGRFVTVRLPEEDRAPEESKGEGSPGKKGQHRSKIPVSNVPLRPPDTPEVAGEKQYLPLEYRGLIH